MPGLSYCTSCHNQTSKPQTKGSGWIEFILWICYIIPGVIYSIWRRSGASTCPFCKNNTLIPSPPVKDTGHSTRECPHCLEEVKAKATLCKHCKSTLEPVEEDDDEGAMEAQVTAKKPADRKSYKILLLGSFIVLIVFVLSNGTSTSKNSTTHKITSPSTACSLLSRHGLDSKKGYAVVYDNEYGCSSRYKEFGNALPNQLRNNIAYYVSGKSGKVESIKLVVNINNKTDATKAHTELAHYASLLEKEAFNRNIGPQRLKAISNGANKHWDLNGVGFDIKRVNWTTGKGYEVRYIITVLAGSNNSQRGQSALYKLSKLSD